MEVTTLFLYRFLSIGKLEINIHGRLILNNNDCYRLTKPKCELLANILQQHATQKTFKCFSQVENKSIQVCISVEIPINNL